MNAMGQTTSEENSTRVQMERQSQRLVTAFIVSGLIFMLLPGTFLGVWNLIGISEQHTAGALSPAWLQAHGQAQIFGWIGSFIIGIGFYSLTKMQSTLTFPARAGWVAWFLWTVGVSLRWLGGVTAWNWRVLLPVSGILQLAAYSLFYLSVRQHRPDAPQRRPEVWMRLVIFGMVGLFLAMAANLAALAYLALYSNTPALPHVLDQQFVVLAVWGVLVPTIWGFNARWLPIFAGFERPANKHLMTAYGFAAVAIAANFLEWWAVSAVLFLAASLLSAEALKVWARAAQPAKLLHVHPSFPVFLRIAYVWLAVSAILAVLAVRLDHAGGIWGASRHAMTVGYIAVMVFTIGQRVLPAFCGMRVLRSTRMMLWSLLLLVIGCTLRVSMEPLAYEGYWHFAWKLLPCSAILEMAAVTLFAWNIIATLLQPPTHLRTQPEHR